MYWKLSSLKNMGFLILLCLFMGGGCASHSSMPGEAVEYDPWEKVNRVTFRFNDGLDRWVAKPVAKGYRAVTPKFVEVGDDNFFDNLGSLTSVFNQLLQAKWQGAGRDTVRFTLNTVAGLGGLVDVAAAAGIEKGRQEDFGQTLQAWGVPEGPYVVLPFLGPSTIVDAVSVPLDGLLEPYTYIDHSTTRISFILGDLLNTRVGLLDVEGLVSGDKYTFYREAYLQNRAFEVHDGVVEDDFGGDLDDFDDF